MSERQNVPNSEEERQCVMPYQHSLALSIHNLSVLHRTCKLAITTCATYVADETDEEVIEIFSSEDEREYG
jgi:hypothetical protein